MVVIEVTLVLVRMVMMAMVVTLAVMMMMASSHTDRACVILFLQSNFAVLFGQIFLQHFIKICNGCIIVSFQEEIAKRNIELPLFSFLVLTTNTYAHQVLLTLTWLTVDPLEYCVKADPAEQVDLRNIRS